MIDYILSAPRSFLLCIKHFGWRRALWLPLVIHYSCSCDIRGRIKIRSGIRLAVRFGFGGSRGVQSRGRGYFIVGKNARLEFSGRANFATGNSLRIDGGAACFGDNFSINKNGKILFNQGIVFGDDVLIGWDFTAIDGTGHWISGTRKEVEPSIAVGSNVWIAAETAILKGGRVPTGSVIAFRSLITSALTKSVGSRENLLIGGSPAEVIRENIEWRR